MLRAKQTGLSLAELDELTEGMVYDLIAEMTNDRTPEEYRQVATQADFDKW